MASTLRGSGKPRGPNSKTSHASDQEKKGFFSRVAKNLTGNSNTNDSSTKGHDTKKGGARSARKRDLSSDRRSARRAPPEALEAQCMECRDISIVYIDPDTGEPYRPQPRLRPEFCEDCGLAWPEDKEYTEEMKGKIKERLRKSKYKDALCDDHASETPDEDEDDRDLDDKQGKRKRGNKRALLIAIRYRDQEKELKDCSEDVENMKLLLKNNGYEEDDIVTLMERWDRYRHPTRDEMIKEMNNLVDGVKDGDHLFVYYSGHGSQEADHSNDERDGRDEVVVPVDYKILEGKNKYLTDDLMHEILAGVNKKVRLTAIFDSCHSGSVLDLPYEVGIERDQKRNVKHVDMVAANQRKKRFFEYKANVILLSGCNDKGTSKETTINGKSSGVMSRAFIEAHETLSKKGSYTYFDLLKRIDRHVYRYNQQPQLSSTKDFNPKEVKVQF